ncbi:Uncharacterised protein [Listeria grayi]|nr:Lmo0850 family protein [Listeria grayi]MBC1921194.1 hypothetical protein [Listeria grayi]STY43881.1 Uncharacterised protein [Listeria grayi]VEI35346.1 Uncharacterised protein [Listeria grayi]
MEQNQDDLKKIILQLKKQGIEVEETKSRKDVLESLQSSFRKLGYSLK